MTEFKTQEFPKENRHCLQFETDNRDYFLRVQAVVRECIDHKPLTNFERLKAMSLEEMAALLDSFSACSNCRKNGNNCFPVFNTEEWLKREVQEEWK